MKSYVRNAYDRVSKQPFSNFPLSHESAGSGGASQVSGEAQGVSLSQLTKSGTYYLCLFVVVFPIEPYVICIPRLS